MGIPTFDAEMDAHTCSCAPPPVVRRIFGGPFGGLVLALRRLGFVERDGQTRPP